MTNTKEMGVETNFRKQILAEMNASRIDHKTYIDSEWLLNEYEQQIREEATKAEEQRWINQPANEHDNRIRAERDREVRDADISLY